MSAPRYDDYAVILNLDHAILLVDNALPAISNNTPHFWQTAESVIQAINAHYGLQVTVVRCLRSDLANDHITNLYLMEYQGGDLPAGARWVCRADLPALPPPASADDIDGWLDWFEGDRPNRRPWYRPGFFRQMVDALPPRLGQTPLAVEQVRSWERSSILRIHTADDSSLYLKSIPQMFAHEPALSAWLAAQSPIQFPGVIDIRPGCDFIMSAYEGTPLIEQPDVDIWGKALAEYAALQVGWASQVSELRALGVPERGLDWIAAHIDGLLADESLLRGGLWPLTDEQIATLRALAPRLHAACDALTAYNIPISLEHGDLWTGQIVIRPDGGFCFTDWSDSAITCPLFSLPFFLAEVHNELPGVPDAPERLRDAYLAPWTAYEPMPHLLEAYEYVRLLSPLYTALQYAYDILPRMEIRWEMENMVGYNLRLLLRAVT
jgi:hypothetical protein